MLDEQSGRPADVASLLARQAQLQGWLDNLDVHAGEVPDRVAERVRADYESRLRQVVVELSAYRDAIAGDAERVRDAALEARETREQGMDLLEESRLRHRIGELSDAEWAGRAAELERQVDDAAIAEEKASTELSRLERLLAAFDSSEGDSATPPAADSEPWLEPLSAPGPTADETRFLEPDEAIEPAPIPEQPEPAESAPLEEDDLEFLTGLDRAMAVPAPPGSELAPEAEPDTRPRPGIRCPECGYTNDTSAWYCGVCGVDLG